ncbi:MAG: histidine phosphatase family protein [Microcoleus sp. PH2017_10_PVI_O_A]|uniref:histidine phosphatase family protein n=1 Tax=unclassified Microcoleus TaxID=2642155 RepID=UPI001E16D977|nr:MULTISPECIES: histidine phosphatase family protein [unclassified Microcoleus]TAE85526.1 MAG: histidine phosphatase family protein [Oscillatoriales cyanobacterium]MCC3404608.1 histidine phosphatase family protein [Microcoleus sp. PH2017_10_PVI_O_A]MCC3458634.1 histidine phosphatase family protein [Microcoleus sp. PH2017_11_PCY_U_A]MCC3476900.1 histidine phosphatase family protein [Microcoleus sp. PH2017_12_PCY_D_A]MCC3526534.1 histidine phosphatase family protein [Microcoleus sp. PH2017_21_R
MSLKIYFLRHGETVYSKSGGFCGDLDPELTAEGSMMAEQFATNYAKLPWDAVYVSPMKRTIATATPLCDVVGIEMQLRDGLKEIKYGKWEGETVESVREKYAQDYINWLTEPAWNAPTEGETSVQIASRSSLVIAEIQEKYKNGNVLVVSHKATIRIILCSLLGIDLGSYRNRIAALAASISIVKFDVRGPMLEVLGDRSHLDENLRNLPGT